LRTLCCSFGREVLGGQGEMGMLSDEEDKREFLLLPSLPPSLPSYQLRLNSDHY
jgi:hypothetical protein